MTTDKLQYSSNSLPSGTTSAQGSPPSDSSDRIGSQPEQALHSTSSSASLQYDQAAPQAVEAAEQPSPPVGSKTTPTESIDSRLEAVRSSVNELSAHFQILARNQETLQNGIRQLGTRVADVASSLAAPRIRELYLRLLMLYDLVEPVPKQLSGEAVSVCRMISTQIDEFLAVNGFERIAADGSQFDAKLHKPDDIKNVNDPALDNRVLSTMRHGFLSQQGVLRPASVVLGRLVEPAAQAQTIMPETRQKVTEQIQVSTTNDKTTNIREEI